MYLAVDDFITKIFIIVNALFVLKIIIDFGMERMFVRIYDYYNIKEYIQYIFF